MRSSAVDAGQLQLSTKEKDSLMDPRRLIHWTLLLIPAMLYILLLLILQPEWSLGTATSLIFLGGAYVMAVAGLHFPLLTRARAVLQVSLAAVGAAHLVLQAAVASFWIFLPEINYSLHLISHLFLGGAFVILFLMMLSSNINVADSVEKQAHEVQLLRAMEQRVAELENASTDKEIEGLLHRLGEDFRYTPKSSLRGMEVMDEGLQRSIDVLETLMRTDARKPAIRDQIGSVASALHRRNQFIKINQ